MTHRRTLVTCAALAIAVAWATRLSVFVASPDFAYVRFGPIVRPPVRELDRRNVGKTVVGESGFPFPAYADCRVGLYGSGLPYVGCSRPSAVGEGSIVLNVLTWFTVFVVVAQAGRRRGGRPQGRPPGHGIGARAIGHQGRQESASVMRHQQEGAKDDGTGV